MNRARRPAPDTTAWRRVAEGEVLPPGAHLMTPRRGYTHHGIHVGAGAVVHYAGLSRTLFRGPVERVSLAYFAGGRALYVRVGGTRRFAPEDIVRRALSRLGEDAYRIVGNNCEHFCEWCCSGEHRSAQVERLLGPVLALLRRFGNLARPARGLPIANTWAGGGHPESAHG